MKKIRLKGLSTQVPDEYIYISDGAYREFVFEHELVRTIHKR